MLIGYFVDAGIKQSSKNILKTFQPVFCYLKMQIFASATPKS